MQISTVSKCMAGISSIVMMMTTSCNQQQRGETQADRKTNEFDTTIPANTQPLPLDTTTSAIPPTDPAATTTPAKDFNSDFRIIAGEKIGRISLGMPQEQMLATMGKPESTDAAMGTHVFTWLGKTKPYHSEVNIVTGYADAGMKKRQVKLVRTTSPYFLTSTGAGVQKDLAELKKSFPKLKLINTYSSANHRASTDIYADEGAGILFECLSNDRKLCVGVQVFQPGALPGMEF